MHKVKSKDIFRASPIKLSDAAFADNQIPERVQLLRSGKYFHHGKEIEVSKDDLDKMVHNFQEGVRGIDLMIDYGHNSEGEAAAWVKNVYVEEKEDGHELWAEVVWTDGGKDSVLSKRYRYISADFHFNYTDNESLSEYGPTLFGAGLTNRPVVKKMQPIIQLSEKYNENLKNEEDSMEEIQKQIDELRAMIMEMKKRSDDDAAMMEGMKKKEVKDEDVKMSEDFKRLQEENEELKKANELREKENTFNKLFAEGKVVEAQRKPFLNGDMVKFSENAAPLNTKETGTGKENEKDQKSAYDKVMELAEKKMKDEQIMLSEAISGVLKENKELSKQYREETK